MASPIVNRTSFHSYAQEHIDEQMRSGVYDFPTALALFSRKGRAAGQLGRPGVEAVIGRPMSEVQRAATSGSTARQIFFQTGELGGQKYLSADGTVASAGNERADNKKKSAYIKWSILDQHISIRNNALRFSKSRYAVGSVIEDATNIAMEQVFKTLAGDIYNGNPSSESDDIWDNPIGLVEWVKDSNTVGGINRSTSSNQYFRGQYDSTSVTVNLDTIDDYMLDNGNVESPLINKGSRADMWLATNSIYRKLKAEARAAGALVTHNQPPESHQVGMLSEVLEYNGKMITLDPYCPANTLFGLDSRTWLFETMADENFRVTPFEDMSETNGGGSSDTTEAHIRVGFRLACQEPWKNLQLDNVST